MRAPRLRLFLLSAVAVALAAAGCTNPDGSGGVSLAAGGPAALSGSLPTGTDPTDTTTPLPGEGTSSPVDPDVVAVVAAAAGVLPMDDDERSCLAEALSHDPATLGSVRSTV